MMMVILLRYHCIPLKMEKDLGFEADTFLSSFGFPASLKSSGGI